MGDHGLARFLRERPPSAIALSAVCSERDLGDHLQWHADRGSVQPSLPSGRSCAPYIAYTDRSLDTRHSILASPIVTLITYGDTLARRIEHGPARTDRLDATKAHLMQCSSESSRPEHCCVAPRSHVSGVYRICAFPLVIL